MRRCVKSHDFHRPFARHSATCLRMLLTERSAARRILINGISTKDLDGLQDLFKEKFVFDLKVLDQQRRRTHILVYLFEKFCS